MTDDNARDEKPVEPSGHTENTGRQEERFPELAELQRDIERCLQSNRKFLDHFLDEDFENEDPPEDSNEPSLDDMSPEF